MIFYSPNMSSSNVVLSLSLQNRCENGGTPDESGYCRCNRGYGGPFCQTLVQGNIYIEREMFYLTTHSTHFIYGYMASDIWLRTILIVRKETRCRLIGYSYRLTTRVLLYAPSHRQDNTYHGLCYSSRGALAGTRNGSMGQGNTANTRNGNHNFVLTEVIQFVADVSE